MDTTEKTPAVPEVLEDQLEPTPEGEDLEADGNSTPNGGM